MLTDGLGDEARGRACDDGMPFAPQAEQRVTFVSLVPKRHMFMSKWRAWSHSAAYLCVGAALVLLLCLTVWVTYRDLQQLRTSLLDAEIHRLRSHADRMVGRLEQELLSSSHASRRSLAPIPWLRESWQAFFQRDSHLYAALVDLDGTVVMHSDPLCEGKALKRYWYDYVVASDVGESIVETRTPALAAGRPVYDIRLPIDVDGEEVGEYHVGLDVDSFDQQVAQSEAALLGQRVVMVLAVLMVVGLAATSLSLVATRSIAQQRAMESSLVERATEVSLLAAGLAHEIRNPLHAVRLNLHVFQRAHQDGTRLSPEEVSRVLEQSSCEIERIDRLMQQLVGFASPDSARNETLDLKAEIEAAVDFLQQELRRGGIRLEMDFTERTMLVHMDRGRVRQILLNLLQNAQQAMPGGGRIEIGLRRRRTMVEMTISDNGPGIAEIDRSRIFEPFFSSKEGGSGLGLALVKRFVDEAKGRIECEGNSKGGTTFRVLLPIASRSQGKVRQA